MKLTAGETLREDTSATDQRYKEITRSLGENESSVTLAGDKKSNAQAETAIKAILLRNQRYRNSTGRINNRSS